jgi:hypothetical protein
VEEVLVIELRFIDVWIALHGPFRTNFFHRENARFLGWAVGIPTQTADIRRLMNRPLLRQRDLAKERIEL